MIDNKINNMKQVIKKRTILIVPVFLFSLNIYSAFDGQSVFDRQEIGQQNPFTEKIFDDPLIKEPFGSNANSNGIGLSDPDDDDPGTGGKQAVPIGDAIILNVLLGLTYAILLRKKITHNPHKSLKI
jgi:hypothetical protein